MSEDKKPDQSEYLIIGTDEQHNPNFMTISVPIKRLSDDPEGSYTLRGMFDEAKQVALTIMRNIRAKKEKTNGIIKPTVQ